MLGFSVRASVDQVKICVQGRISRPINGRKLIYEGVSRGGEGYSHMFRQKVPHFSAWAAPKDSTFSTWTAPKDPPFSIHLFVPVFRPGLLQKTPLLKNRRFFVTFSPKIALVFQ